MSTRTDKVTFRGNPITLGGNEVSVGQAAPDFTVTRPPFDSVKLSDQKGKVVLISVTPSVDTGVCDKQMRELNKRATDLSSDVLVWNLSVDLPFALKRYCAAAEISRVEALSDYKNREFGQKFGTYMEELGLLARSVFIVDREGTLVYKQIVPEMTSEPNYDDALNALKGVVG